MFPKQYNQIKQNYGGNNRTCFCTYCEEVTELYFLLINTILFSIDEKELRSNIELLWKAVPIDKYFTYGYGAHHLWVCQRQPSDMDKVFEHRIMIARF